MKTYFQIAIAPGGACPLIMHFALMTGWSPPTVRLHAEGPMSFIWRSMLKAGGFTRMCKGG